MSRHKSTYTGSETVEVKLINEYEVVASWHTPEYGSLIVDGFPDDDELDDMALEQQNPAQNNPGGATLSNTRRPTDDLHLVLVPREELRGEALPQPPRRQADLPPLLESQHRRAAPWGRRIEASPAVVLGVVGRS